MTTLAELEKAVFRLSDAELIKLELLVRKEKLHRTARGSHSILDIPPITLGALLPSLGSQNENGGETTMSDSDSWLTQSIGLTKIGRSTNQILEESRGDD